MKLHLEAGLKIGLSKGNRWQRIETINVENFNPETLWLGGETAQYDQMCQDNGSDFDF